MTLCIAVSVSEATRQSVQGTDILDTGIVVRGKTEQSDMNDSGKTIAFSVSSEAGFVLLRASFDDAFGPARSEPKRELTALIFAKLLKHVTSTAYTTVRFADWRDLPPGTHVNEDLLNVALCLISDKDKGFYLQCVDAMKSHESKPGDTFLFDGSVVADKETVLGRYLRGRRSVLVRIEG
jgi:hypothetical protein